MIILNSSAASQSISVIPRRYDSDFIMSIRDDSTNTTEFYTVTGAVTVNNYLQFQQAFTALLVENHFYDIHLYINSSFWNTNLELWDFYDVLWQDDTDYVEVLFKDKIFCTDQDINELTDNDYYQLNKGVYDSYDGFNNQYTVR
mgnify:FL=1|jgi:hypothetical protein|tara:strand:- start:813 stop:1244 length:432 start_codon:yes stop_codon:yes gene_type:complete